MKKPHKIRKTIKIITQQPKYLENPSNFDI